MAVQDGVVETSNLRKQPCELEKTHDTFCCLQASVLHQDGKEPGYILYAGGEQNTCSDDVGGSRTDVQCELYREAGTGCSTSHCSKLVHICKDDAVKCDFVQCEPQSKNETTGAKWDVLASHPTSAFDCVHTVQEPPDEFKGSDARHSGTDNSFPDHLGAQLPGPPVTKCVEHSLDEEEENLAHQPKSHDNRAHQELQEIYSESQRMIRESPVVLPYHDPPRFSFKQFLAMRRGKTENSSPAPLQSALQVPVEAKCGLIEDEGQSTPQEKPTLGSMSVLFKQRLATAGHLEVTPQLSEGPLVISSSPGMCDLLERFTKHTKEKIKKERCVQQALGLSAISRQAVGRRCLKDQLMQQVMEKREKVLQERWQQHRVCEEELEEPFLSGSEESTVEDECEDVDRDTEGLKYNIVEEEVDDGEEIVSFRKRRKNYNPFIGRDEADDDKGFNSGEVDVELEEDGYNGVSYEEEGSVIERNDQEESCPGDRKPVGGKKCSWDSALDDLDVFSPISGLTSVRHQGQNNDDYSSTTSSPAKSPACQCLFHRSELLVHSGALEAQAGNAPWVCSQHVSTQQEMDELIGLCSGSFDARARLSQDTPKLDDDRYKDLEGDHEITYERSDEGGSISGASTRRNNPKDGFSVQDFFEDEAELSGSDIGSDDEESADEEQLLADLLASDTQPLDEEAIREEVGRLHLKHLLDQDKRQLKVYQEMLLEDGDLHSEGGGRQRKFRWKCAADANVVDGPKESDSEGEDVGTEEDMSWRLQRFEREQWLRDQVSKAHTDSPTKVPNQLRVVTSVRMQDKEEIKKGACGSFLRMGSGALSRIAERLKVNRPVDNTGSLTTKNFVFRSVDEMKELKRPSSAPLPSSSKKVKVAPLQASSVFDHLHH